MIVVGCVAVGHPGFRQVLLEPAAVHFLRRAGAEKDITPRPQTGDRQIAVKLALGGEKRREIEAPGLGQAPGQHPVEKGFRAGPAHHVFREIGNLHRPNTFAHGLDFRRHVRKGVGAPEGRLLARFLGTFGKPEHMFQAEARAHDGTLGQQAVIKRGRFLAPHGRQFFVGIGEQEAPQASS